MSLPPGPPPPCITLPRDFAPGPRIFFSPSPPHPNHRPRLPLVLTQCYLNDLLASNFDVAKDWCYTGVGVMPNDAAMRDYLRVNDWSYPHRVTLRRRRRQHVGGG